MTASDKPVHEQHALVYPFEGEQIIVGDIGGTNGRFALATIEAGKPKIEAMHTYMCAEYPHFSDMMANFLSDIGKPHTAGSRLAIAGPTSRDFGHITNLRWDVDARALEQDLGLSNVVLLNDFAALAYAASVLEPPHVTEIKKGKPVKGAPISVMGPGTGFGVSLLVHDGGEWTVVPTEGGHLAFAPSTQLEDDLCKHLRKEHEYVCVETLVSGAGLARIHKFLVDYAGSGDPTMTPAQISAAAMDGSNPSCMRAVQLFLSILGGVAGDIALTHGAQGGVYFGGGILPKIASQLDGSDLKARFVAKGKLSDYMNDIPIHLITSGEAALIGAAMAP